MSIIQEVTKETDAELREIEKDWEMPIHLVQDDLLTDISGSLLLYDNKKADEIKLFLDWKIHAIQEDFFAHIRSYFEWTEFAEKIIEELSKKLEGIDVQRGDNNVCRFLNRKTKKYKDIYRAYMEICREEYEPLVRNLFRERAIEDAQKTIREKLPRSDIYKDRIITYLFKDINMKSARWSVGNMYREIIVSVIGEFYVKYTTESINLLIGSDVVTEWKIGTDEIYILQSVYRMWILQSLYKLTNRGSKYSEYDSFMLEFRPRRVLKESATIYIWEEERIIGPNSPIEDINFILWWDTNGSSEQTMLELLNNFHIDNI